MDSMEVAYAPKNAIDALGQSLNNCHVLFCFSDVELDKPNPQFSQTSRPT